MIVDGLHQWLFPSTQRLTERVERWMPEASRGRFDREVRRQRMFVRGAVGVLEIVAPIALVFVVLRAWAQAASATALCVVAFASLRLVRAGRFERATSVLFGALLVVVSASAWLAGDQLMAAWIWAPTIPVMALSVGGTRAGVRWLVHSAMAFLAVMLLREVHVAPPMPLSTDAARLPVFATGIGALFALVGLAGAYENDMARSVEDAEARARELTEAQGRLEALHREVSEARDAAEAGLRARSEFLAVMSHEVRTPMNAVLGMTTLLLDSPLSREQRDYVDVIRASGDALLTVLNDALDYSKIEAGRVALEVVPYEPAAEVRQVVELMRGVASARNNRLELRVAPDVPEAVLSDPGRMRQVLLNLLSNALKFTADGEVSVSLHLEGTGERERLCVEVSDTGIGIAPEALPYVFDPFTQADATTTRRFGGTGLGLAISRRLSGLLGGSLEAASRVGHGSVFTLRIPVVRAHLTPAPRTRRDPQPTPAPARSLHVLVAEDNAVNQKVIALLVERLGHRVDTVANGVEVVAALQRARYDVVLMDVQMPEMDGLEATRLVRAREAKGRRVPIVALTANAYEDDRRRCLEAGMDDFLAKPVRREQLKLLLLRCAADIAEAERAAADAAVSA